MRQHDLRRLRNRFRRHKHDADPAHEVCMFRRTRASRHPRLRSETVIAVQVRYCRRVYGANVSPHHGQILYPNGIQDFPAFSGKWLTASASAFSGDRHSRPQANVVRESRGGRGQSLQIIQQPCVVATTDQPMNTTPGDAATLPRR